MNDLKKIEQLTIQGKVDDARDLLKKINYSEFANNTNVFETFFLSLIKSDYLLRAFLKHLKINRVPPLPINTKMDLGKRFFYTLYILNRLGGERFVKPYIEQVHTNTAMEYCFLGGIYFFNFNYKKAKEAYLKSKEILLLERNKQNQLQVYGNLAASCIYSEDYNQYEQIKEEAFAISKNDSAVVAKFHMYELLKFIQLQKIEKARKVYNDCIKNNAFQGTLNTHQYTLDVMMTSVFGNKDEFIKSFNLFSKSFQEIIKSGNTTPERFLGACAYISTITIHEETIWDDINPLKNSIYPFHIDSMRGKSFACKDFSSIGSKLSKSYLNMTTEEYSINGISGVGLSTELKALYWIARSHEFGISFETLATFIYDDVDFAGIFMIKNRVKQIGLRLKKIYGINLKMSISRIYIKEEELNKIYISQDGDLKIHDLFSIYDFMTFYNISKSKAQNRIAHLTKIRKIEKLKIGKINKYKKISF